MYQLHRSFLAEGGCAAGCADNTVTNCFEYVFGSKAVQLKFVCLQRVEAVAHLT